TILKVVYNRVFGIGLPVLLGYTFTAVAPMIAIGGENGISDICDANVVSGLLVFLISRFFVKLVRFIQLVATGAVVTIIGITLIPVAINNMGGGQDASDFGFLSNISLAFGTLLFIIIMYRFSKGFMKAISILLSLVAGTIVAAFMGKVNLSAVS